MSVLNRQLNSSTIPGSLFTNLYKSVVHEKNYLSIVGYLIARLIIQIIKLKPHKLSPWLVWFI